MPTDNAAAWDRYSAAYQAAAQLPTDVASYGPDIADESALRLCGHVAGKRVLDLGCGGGQSTVAFAKQGARTIAVDASAEQLAFARRLAHAEGVKAELHQGDLADLAFVRADHVDLVFSSEAFGYVEDLDRVFRQVHRVLKPDAPLVFSIPHPFYDLIDDDADPALLVRRSYFDRSPLDVEQGGVSFTRYRRTIGDLFTSLTRANFRIDTVLEPEPHAGGSRSFRWNEAFRSVPRTLIVRARKLGF